MEKRREVRQSQVLWEVFDRKMRKFRLIASGVIVFLLISAGCLFFLLSQTMQKKTQTTKPTIALVNEDQPAAFNNQNYNFGQSFVNLVSNDSKYNWQVVARGVANKAYSDGSVQAVIYLPQDFSHNILTLQAIDPQKAQVDYKVVDAQSKLTNNLLQDKIVNVLYDFNTSIVKMYYASVAGNVADAQTNMNNVVNSQGAILTNLNNSVYGPFQETNEGYSSVVSVATSLQDQNDNWIEAQNSFTDTVTKMLNSNSEAFDKQLPNLTQYFDTQKQIVDTNLVNANKGITNQADSDQSYYYGLYTTAYNKALQALQQFRSTDESGNENGIYAKLKTQITDYNTLISGVRDDIGNQVKNLDEKRTSLLELEKNLYSEFFAQEVAPTADSTDFTSLETDDNARAALANLLSSSFEGTDNLKDKAYSSTISTLLSQVSVESSQYEPLLQSLVSNGSLTVLQEQQINGKLDVLKNYATAFGLPTATVNFSDVPATEATEQKMTKTLSITVPAGSSYILSFSAGGGLTNAAVSLDPATPPTGTGIDASNPNSIVLDNSTSTTTTDADGNPVETAPTQPQTYTITYVIDLGEVKSGTVTFNWGTGADQHSTQDIFTLAPTEAISEYAGGEEFSTITTLLNNIDTATQLIAFLYGAPGATAADMTGITDFVSSADSKSVYKMYGNMDKSQMAERLSDDDVTRFKEQGTSHIKDVTDTLETLSSTISSLATDQTRLTDNLPSDYFAQIINELDTWCQQTMTTLDTQYNAWTKNQTTPLEEKSWQEYNESEIALYYDKASGEDLYKTISELVSSSSKQAKDTADSAQIIKSNSDTFTQMVETVTKTQTAAKEVIDNTGNLLSTGNSDFLNSQTYNGKFETVLSNTRSNDANANNIFSFFAKPLSTKDVTPEAKEVTPGFDWRWIIIFAGGILLGVLGKTWIRMKPKSEE
ncbi:type VII secretion protein EsaA [Lactovum odontotermitis]